MTHQVFMEYYVHKHEKFRVENNSVYSNYKWTCCVYIIAHHKLGQCIKYFYNPSSYISGLQKFTVRTCYVTTGGILYTGTNQIFSKLFKNYEVWCISSPNFPYVYICQARINYYKLSSVLYKTIVQCE